MPCNWSAVNKLFGRCKRISVAVNRVLHTNCKRYKSKEHFSDTVTVSMATFKFSDYDCVGFDLDNTLLHYKVTDQTDLIYNIVVKYLVNEKGYNSKYLLRPLSEQDYDFMQKGLMLDFERGNVLRICPEGLIRKACHGTKLLTTAEINEVYHDQRWEVADQFSKDYIATWNGPISERLRNFLDYFDISVPLIFAKIVDTLDEESGKPLTSYNIWPDIRKVLVWMFAKDEACSVADYYSTLEQNPDKYLHKCDEETLSWLKEIKKERAVFMITGSYPSFIETNASYMFGKDWKSLFDIVVCLARKPNFFVCHRPFYGITNGRPDKVVDGNDLKRGEMYIGGCWEELLCFLKNLSKKSDPSCLYVGDNLLQDIYAPSVYAKIDTVAVIEEQMSERMFFDHVSHPDEKILNSKLWGSYFCLDGSTTGNGDSLWGNIIRKYSKLCIPNINYVAKNPLDYPYKCFERHGRTFRGYYPGAPLIIKTKAHADS